ncbi:hypothetical protein OG883_02765 [Streptomyces sp. NBC_01142]|uniref:hypothetical protein n=1 Tax=Streptomyces sp. NBC_01142 TaxID=2975865 RepID=UPI00225B93DC|nr:hypothetical protein [Streptomyces sp. NBC_01142]MCX4818840.1 hypothetical protein [Streptomyces sp. NBC_01142]
MHKNIRRSIAVAATATGMWALGTAAASADELPVSVPLSTPDQAADAVEDVKGVDLGAVTDLGVVKELGGAVHGVQGVTSDVQGKAAGTADRAKGAAHGATQNVDAVQGVQGVQGAQNVQGLGAFQAVEQNDVRAVADQARQYAEGKLAAYDVAAGVSDVADTQGEIDYLFGPLSAFAPELEQAPGHAQAGIQDGVTTATPVVDAAAQDVLPPVAGRAVDGVLPVAGQAVGDVGGLAQGVVGDVTPFAGGVVSEVQPFAGGVVSEVQPFVGGVGGAVQPLVETVVDHVQPVVHGVGGSAGTLAQGVVGDVTPFAGGVVSEVQPFAQDLSGTVTATPLAGNAVIGAQGAATSVTPGYASHLTQGIAGI